MSSGVPQVRDVGGASGDPVAAGGSQRRDPHRGEPPGLSELCRRWLAAPVALLASALAVVCVISLADILPQVGLLFGSNERFVGWAGLGVCLGVGVTAVSLLLMRRTGAGPSLSAGAAAAVFGLALGYRVIDDLQVGLAFVMLGAAVGGLLTGAAGMAFELPGRFRTAVLLAWVVPLVSGWPLVAWVALHDTATDEAQLTVHPSVWALAPVSAVIVLWSVVSMLVEPPRVQAPAAASWETAWSALLVVLVVGALAVMVAGFEPGIDVGWLRPLVVGVAGLVVVALAAVALVVPAVPARIGYVAVLVVCLSLPTCVQLMLVVTDAGAWRVSWIGAGLLAVFGVVGAGLGWRWPATSSWAAMLVLAGACAGAWVMPDGMWTMFAAAAPLMAAAGAGTAAGVRLCTSSPTALRFVMLTVVGVILLGVTLAIPLGWSLGGAVASTTEDARAAGRVFLGLTFAAAVLAAAYIATLTPRLRAG